MTRAAAASALLLWAGTTLLLSHLRWFSRPDMVDRLRPYVRGGWQHGQVHHGAWSVGSLWEVAAPLVAATGDRMGRVLGIHDDLAARLARAHSPVDVAGARLRQVGWALGAFGATGITVVALGVTAGPGLALLLGAPFLAGLVIERQLTTAAEAWQRRVFLELPVVCEQLGMLLGAGYSLGAALDRLAARGTGACARDLTLVGRRVGQGLTVAEALQEWSRRVDVPAVDRLVSVLALDRDTGDLAGLIAEEARALRHEAHRELIATIERRAQQVWIPVTVATLVPGTIFLAVPFLDALRAYSA